MSQLEIACFRQIQIDVYLPDASDFNLREAREPGPRAENRRREPGVAESPARARGPRCHRGPLAVALGRAVWQRASGQPSGGVTDVKCRQLAGPVRPGWKSAHVLRPRSDHGLPVHAVTCPCSTQETCPFLRPGCLSSLSWSRPNARSIEVSLTVRVGAERQLAPSARWPLARVAPSGTSLCPEPQSPQLLRTGRHAAARTPAVMAGPSESPAA